VRDEQSGLFLIDRRPHERGGSGGVGGVHVRAPVEQQLHGFRIAIDGGEHQRGVAPGVAGIDGRAGVQGGA